MKIQNHIKSAVALLVLGATAQAMATPVTLNASGVGGYLSAGAYLGTFDGTGLLPANFTVNSIEFSFLFSDDVADVMSSVTTNGPATTVGPVKTAASGRLDVYTTTTTQQQTTTKTGEQESAKVSFGNVASWTNQTAGSPVTAPVQNVPGTPTTTSISYQGSGHTVCTNETQWIAINNGTCKKTVYQSVTNKVITTTGTDYAGDFGIGSSLINYQSLLSDLVLHKVLNFSIDVTGDLNLVSAALNLDVTEVIPLPPNAVPEPNALALFGIGVLGMAGVRRARRK